MKQEHRSAPVSQHRSFEVGVSTAIRSDTKIVYSVNEGIAQSDQVPGSSVDIAKDWSPGTSPVGSDNDRISQYQLLGLARQEGQEKLAV